MNTKTLKNNCNIYNTFVLENMLVMSDEFLTQTCNTFNSSNIHNIHHALTNRLFTEIYTSILFIIL